MNSFIVYSFSAFFIIAIVLIAFVSFHIKKDQIYSDQKLVRLTLNHIVGPILDSSDFNTNTFLLKTELFDAKIQELVNDGTISSVKIWNVQNNVVYSSNNEDKYTDTDNNFKKELINNIDYVIFEQKINTHTKRNTEFIRFYLPIIYNNKTIATYEVTKPYSDMRSHIKEITIIVSIIISLGLVLLYILLIKIIYSSSKTLISQNKNLIEKNLEIESAYTKLNESYKSTIITLSNSIDARDQYTAGHSERVAMISLDIGKQLGLSKDKLVTLEVAALLHDIGKIGITDEVLHKSSKLSDYEYNKMKEHPAIGANILNNIEFLKDAIPIILYHHERFNGSGYPLGLKNDKIPLGSRIVAVADAYDAMVSDRPYRKGMHHDIAISELVKFRNIQFDGLVVDNFLKIQAK